MMQYFKCDKGFIATDKAEEACWTDFGMPSKDDLIVLIEKLKVPASFLESLSDPNERPRLDQEAGWRMAILRIAVPGHDDGPPYRTVPFGILAKDNKLLTICYFRNPLIDDFVKYSQRRELKVDRAADFTMHIMMSAAFWFQTYLKHLDDEVTGAKRDLEKNVRNSDLLWLMRVQQSLVYFNTAIKGDEVLLDRLQGIFGDDFDHDLHDDLEVEIKQADNTVNVYTEILEGTMDAYGSIISNNVNMVMKRMTSITIVLMVPTLVASFYGMNVKDLALANVAGSFWIVIAIAAILTGLVYLWLRKIRWF